MTLSDTYEDATSKFSHSRRWITILFTDIVDSTRHWHEMGDVETRYRIEQHNQNLIPIVVAYDGEVVKTIGDSIMASFEDPQNAVRAAIAMQHALHAVREKDPEFELKVRIGIHRGRAIVEDEDVFGNTVNVAARVEDQAQGDEILVSDSVAQYLDQERYYLSRRGSFTPRGKSNSILLYRVSWWRSESLLEKVPRSRRAVSIARVRRSELILCSLLASAGLLIAAVELLPAALGGRPGWLGLALNPVWTAMVYPGRVASGLVAVVAGLAAIGLWRPGWVRFLRAAAVFFASFAAIQGAAVLVAIEWPGSFRHDLGVDELTLVTVEEPAVQLRTTPSRDAPAIAELTRGHRLPLDQRSQTRSQGAWLRVAVAPGRFGWLPEAGGDARPQLGPARFRSIVARDLYACALATCLALGVFVRGHKGNAPRRLASV
ncbi:MAG: hypothetical protein GY733_12640 [bacterium]|nr:hypothetical protein [bacterium]